VAYDIGYDKIRRQGDDKYGEILPFWNWDSLPRLVVPDKF